MVPFNEDGQFYVDEAALIESVISLVEKLLVIELTGEYDGAKALIDDYRYVSPQVQTVIDGLAAVPVDVIKQYPFDSIAKRLWKFAGLDNNGFSATIY